MAPLTIGAHTLRHGLLLAPMAGVADTAFREICRRFGAEYTVSEMISAKALCFEQKGRASAPARTATLANITEAESPMALPERPKKNHKTCEASAKHLSTKRHQSGTKRFFHERAPIGHETLIRERARIGHETLIRERTRIGHETLIHEKDTNRTRKGF
jgi:UDP-3-O-[3-hydroxymyristoyl] glucosamine N-acyltransferase